MGSKVYAIKEGFNPATNEKIEDKIVGTWAECLKYVKGVKGAKYKSFELLEDAKKYLQDSGKLLKKGEHAYPEDCLHIYVDGSYNSSTAKYSYGMVAVRDNVVEHIDSAASKDSSKSNIRQIAGELEGAVKGVEYALSKGEKKVVIFHDYEGVSHHATGFWERREPSSAEYYAKMQNFISEGIELIFVKVDSHTGDLFNELVDEKCKEKLGIQSEGTVAKWLKKNVIKVYNHIVKEEILNLAPMSGENIKIIARENEQRHKENISSMEVITQQIEMCSNEEACVYDEFEKIIKIYKLTTKEAEGIVNKLKTKEKTELIMFLLKKISEK